MSTLLLLTAVLAALALLLGQAHAAAASIAIEDRAPGRAAVWRFGEALSKDIQYNTLSSNYKTVGASLEGVNAQAEATLVLRGQDFKPVQLTDDVVVSFARSSPVATVFPNIYRPSGKDASVSLHEHLSQSDLMREAKKISLEELHSHLSKSVDSREGAMFNGRPDVFEVALSGHAQQDASRLAEIAKLSEDSGRTVAFVAYQEPGVAAAAPASASHYRRVLSTSSSNLLDGDYYNPEGAEYSIYYANKFLYITPDIFTGLLTGLFLAGVIYTGLSCMGKIQGGSSFPTKKIDIGKEY